MANDRALKLLDRFASEGRTAFSAAEVRDALGTSPPNRRADRTAPASRRRGGDGVARGGAVGNNNGCIGCAKGSIGVATVDGADSIWTNNAEQMHKVMQEVRHRVREQLTPDQQKQFDELMRRAPQRHGMTNAPPGGVPANTNAPGV